MLNRWNPVRPVWGSAMAGAAALLFALGWRLWPDPRPDWPRALELAGSPKESIQPVSVERNSSIAVIGDSITANGGYLRIADRALKRLRPDLDLPPLINLGVPGQKAEDLAARFEADVLRRKPAVVMINIGVNDVWHRLKQPHDPEILAAYRQNLANMVSLARQNGIQVMLLTPTLIGEDPASPGNRRLALYVAAMKDVAREQPCFLSDLHALFLNALEHKPGTVYDLWLTTDGVHMSPLGDVVMAIGVLRALGIQDGELQSL